MHTCRVTENASVAADPWEPEIWRDRKVPLVVIISVAGAGAAGAVVDGSWTVKAVGSSATADMLSSKLNARIPQKIKKHLRKQVITPPKLVVL